VGGKMAKYCTNCGAELEKDCKFCVKCGNKNIQRESDKKRLKKTVDKKATMADEKTRLNQLTEKIRGWKEEGYKVDELESKIKDIEIQTPHIEAKPSIPPIREPKYGYVLGVIALFVILAVIAGGIYGVYLDSIDNGYTETDIYEYGEDEVILGDTDGDGIDDFYDVFPYDSTQWSDYDGDGYGDNPFGNYPDAFPDDPYRWEEE